MKLTVNGQKQVLDLEQPHVEGLLAHLGYEPRYLAVAVNQSFVSRHAYATVQLEDGDDVEILRPMQGG